MHERRHIILILFSLSCALAFVTNTTPAQTPTTFTYQGRLSTSGSPASGSYDMQFKLFDALADGNQIGGTLTNPTVAVAAGFFKVELDFAAGAFDGAPRFLEIYVRPAVGNDPYTVLSPRQAITSTPYALHSANSAIADGLSAACVGCVSDSHIEMVDGSKISGSIPIESVPTGSDNYIQNSAAAERAGKVAPRQAGGFNIEGDGVVGGALSANLVESAIQFNLAGNRILSNAGNNNLFVGVGAGEANSTGSDNAFFGAFAGQANQAGSANSFFGVVAGFNNTGNDNSFFGRSAGFTNTSGSSNSFFGVQAGRDNSTGSFNSFFGQAAGKLNITGGFNAFFGYQAGFSNTLGGGNAFFGYAAGFLNTTGDNNAIFGADAGFNNTTGANNAFFGTQAGGANTMGSSNAFFGRQAGDSNTQGTNNTIIGTSADVGMNTLDHATAIGADAIVTASNTVQIGRIGVDKAAIGAFAPSTSKPVCINGQGVLAGCTPFANPICINANGDFIACSSSLRYKANVRTFAHGMELLRKLRPVAYTWKEDGRADVGLIAEEVAEVEPRLTIYNTKGEIEGVKYAQLTVVLVNAVREQQAQIESQQTQIREREHRATIQQTQLEQYRKQLATQQTQITEQGAALARQQREIDALRQLLCQAHLKAEVCQATRRKQ